MSESMVPHSVMVSQIDAAVRSVYEDCARAAEEYGRMNPYARMAANLIADKIRWISRNLPNKAHQNTESVDSNGT